MIVIRHIHVGHSLNKKNLQIFNASDQWLGATVQSGGPDGVIVVSAVCLKSACSLFQNFLVKALLYWTT